MKTNEPLPLALVEILFVEDNPRDAEMTMRALRKCHLADRLLWVKDGAEALAFLQGRNALPGGQSEARPKLVLLDLKLPKVNGQEVLQRMKQDPRTSQIPVVVLTSSREERDIVRMYETGVNSYIVKPVNFERFTEAISQLGMYWVTLNQPSATLEEGPSR